MTPDEWGSCVLALKAFYSTSFKLDGPMILVWYEELKGYPGPVVSAAIRHMARTTKAFPSLAEIVEHIEGPAAKPDHSKAWGELMAKMQTVGSYPLFSNGKLSAPDPKFDDPILPEVVERLGGWVHICRTMTVEGETTWRAQFRQAYDAAHARRRRETTFARLNLPAEGFTGLLGEAGGES